MKIQKPVVTLMQLEGMDPVAARKLIAQDAIDGIKAKYYIAVPGMYFTRISEDKVDDVIAAERRPGRRRVDVVSNAVLFLRNNNNEDAREALMSDRKEGACGVCALGTMLLSSIQRFNSCTVGDIGFVTGSSFGSQPREYLQKFFSEEDLAWAEACFEGKTDYIEDTPVCYSRDNAVRVMYFYDMYRYDPDTRLMAIFQTILDSADGHFVPPQPTAEFLESVAAGAYYSEIPEEEDEEEIDGDFDDISDEDLDEEDEDENE